MPLATLALAFALATAPQTWSFDTGSSPKVIVSDIAGLISVKAVPGHTVDVEALQTGQPSEWVIEVKSQGNVVHARACCGSCEHEASGHSCRSGAVEFRLKVPASSDLEIESVSAPIETVEISGPQRIHSVSGRIGLAGQSGSIEVESVSGEVSLSPRSPDRTRVRTVSGDVEVALPSPADAQVRLTTVSGKWNGQREIRGSTEHSYGKGTARIDVNTVSGGLDVKS